jgi:hypothetical protein
MVVLYSCSHEKEIQKTESKTFFVKNGEENSSAFGINVNPPGNTENSTGSSTFNAKSSLVNEIRSNNIPRQLPNEDYPGWQSFSRYMKSIKPGISNAAQQYCSDLFLRSYNFTEIKKPEKAAVNAVVENMECW